jgi:arsenical pump membrane protein
LAGHVLTWAIVASAIFLVILRPFGLHEAFPATAGALLLVLSGLLPWRTALHGIGQGADVYLFLTGMMLLAELARREQLFSWLAAKLARHAAGSPKKLFFLLYAMGVAVTVFLSNDATAVVLSPAVAAVVRAVEAKNPLPYLLICAFVANAASFVLPISNPANLVIYGAALPPLLAWLRHFALPSALAILVTFIALRCTQSQALRQTIAHQVAVPALPQGGLAAACGIIVTALVLMAASAFGLGLGAPTFLAGLATTALVLWRKREAPWPLLKSLSWGVLPLVAGLFVMVAALDQSGFTQRLSHLLAVSATDSPRATPWGAGLLLGLGVNLINNLPAGLLAGHAAQAAHAPAGITSALLIGVDIGPNLSVTGSLATILWLTALRREGLHVSSRQFLRLGAVIMPPALLLALAGLWVLP